MTPQTQPTPAEVQEAIDNIDDVAACLAERIEPNQKEILTGVTECRNRLDALSTQIQIAQPESPLLNRLMEELLTVKSDLLNLKSSMEEMKAISRTPLLSVSEPVPVEVVEVREPAEPSPAELIAEPVPAVADQPTPEPEPKRRQRRVL